MQFNPYVLSPEASAEEPKDGPEVLQAQTTFKESECIYDYNWFPAMSDQSNSCFASTARDSPIHLWDLFTGKVRYGNSPSTTMLLADTQMGLASGSVVRVAV